MDSSESPPPPEAELLGSINLMIVGDGAVGKSQMLQAYCGDDPNDGCVSMESVKSATIGVDVRTRVANVRGLPTKLQFYDTAGSERFRSLVRAQYQRAHGLLVMFDFTQRDTFSRLDGWIREIRAAAKQQPLLMLAGNKVELEDRRTVSVEEADAFAQKNGLRFRMLSAFNRRQVVSVVEDLAHQVLLTPRLYRPSLDLSEVYVLLLKLQTRTHMRLAKMEERLDAIEDRITRAEQPTPKNDGCVSPQNSSAQGEINPSPSE